LRSPTEGKNIIFRYKNKHKREQNLRIMAMASPTA
jgi:hypothetical protein